MKVFCTQYRYSPGTHRYGVLSSKAKADEVEREISRFNVMMDEADYERIATNCGGEVVELRVVNG